MLPADAALTRLRTERTKLQVCRLARLTVKSYGYDWRGFEAWCKAMHLPSMPASSDTVSLYLTDMLDQGRKVATAWRRGSSIAHYHRQAGHQSPFTEESYGLLIATQRLRLETKRQMRPLPVADLRKIVRSLAKLATPLAIRDRAILLVGFASALRRSTLVELTLEDIEFVRKGVIIEVLKEKQDQAGRGRLVGVPNGNRPDTCPVRALAAWVKVRGSHPGPVFPRMQNGAQMTGEAIDRVVKRCVALIGLDPKDRWGAHSLRAGFVTAAAEENCSELLIRAQTGHRSNALRDYFRRTQLFKANAAASIGL